MTAKDKALLIMANINNPFQTVLGLIDELDRCTSYSKNELKRKALICVDEVLNELSNHQVVFGIRLNTAYWQEVKQEIEKL